MRANISLHAISIDGRSAGESHMGLSRRIEIEMVLSQFSSGLFRAMFAMKETRKWQRDQLMENRSGLGINPGAPVRPSLAPPGWRI